MELVNLHGGKEMKKRLLAVLLTATMVFAMTACGSSDDSATTEATTETTTEATTEEATTVDASEIKIGMVTDTGGVNDGAFNQSSWEGLVLAGEELGVTVNYLESQTDSDYTANIETFMDEGYDLIISVGYMLAEATYQAAEANPDQMFAIIDDTTCSDLPNVLCLMFEQAEASYLAGYVAGLETESGVVGFVLGMSSSVMHEFGYGFTAGVLAANPDATVVMADANSFGDSAMGKSLTTSMITEGADVVFHAAGGTGLGVIEAAQEAGIKAIGVDSDQSSLAPGTVITSALKRVDTASYDAAKAILEGTFETGIKVYDLASDGVGIVEDDSVLSAETLEALADAKSAILSGEIEVPNDQESFEAIYGADVYTLD